MNDQTTNPNQAEVAARLAQINAAVEQASQGSTHQDPGLAAFTCPMDPAERAACDSCQ